MKFSQNPLLICFNPLCMCKVRRKHNEIEYWFDAPVGLRYLYLDLYDMKSEKAMGNCKVLYDRPINFLHCDTLIVKKSHD